MEFIGKGNLIGNIYDKIILEEDNERDDDDENSFSKNRKEF